MRIGRLDAAAALSRPDLLGPTVAVALAALDGKIDAAAVGETVGDGGLVLADKAPMTLATAVHRVLSDGDARRSIIEAGTRRARSFSLPAGRASLGRAIDDAVTAAAEMGIGS